MILENLTSKHSIHSYLPHWLNRRHTSKMGEMHQENRRKRVTNVYMLETILVKSASGTLCSAIKWKSPNSGATLSAKEQNKTHQYLYKGIPETEVTSSLMEHLICLCKTFGGTLGWSEWYTPALGPCFLFPKRYFWEQTPIYAPSNRFNYPKEKDHDALSLHMSILVLK